jgi:LL-diaminopimelate aminotransferase
MPLLNEHFRKLPGQYLFPEIERRVADRLASNASIAPRLIRAGIGDVTEPLPAACVAALHESADEMAQRETFRGYGPSAGHGFLREAIVGGEYAGLGIDPSEIFVSDGSKGDAGHALEIFASGNRVGIADPVYPVYVDTNVLAGRTGPLREDAFFEGLHPLRANEANGFVPAIPDVPLDLVYLCFPNNPTGAMIDRETLSRWVAWACEHDATILYDGAYADYVDDPSLPRTIYEIPDAKRCAMEFRSLSKSAGFTGLRARTGGAAFGRKSPSGASDVVAAMGHAIQRSQLAGSTRRGRRVLAAGTRRGRGAHRSLSRQCEDPPRGRPGRGASGVGRRARALCLGRLPGRLDQLGVLRPSAR